MTDEPLDLEAVKKEFTAAQRRAAEMAAQAAEQEANQVIDLDTMLNAATAHHDWGRLGLYALPKCITEIERLRAIAAEQAEDEGLWFVAQNAAEGYLQAQLRRLHEAIEGKSAEECARAVLD